MAVFRRHRRISDEAYVIDGMTNWQNHQWMRAGSPRSLKAIKRFALMVHP